MKITFRNKDGQRETIETRIVEIEDKIGGRYRIQNDFEKGIEINAEHSESIPVAGINNENTPQSPTAGPQPLQEGGEEPSPAANAPASPLPSRERLREGDQGSGMGPGKGLQGDGLPTKKATTIMPKDVFIALQRYCTDTDTPKHRALYLFIVEGLHRAGQITDAEAQHFRDMAALLTTTYEKK